jgi:hypothetical protein
MEKQLSAMKTLLATFSLLFYFTASSQHYYIDIIGTKETSGIMQAYLKNKVRHVVLTSYDETNAPIKDFYVEQEFDEANRVLKTITRSDVAHESTLLSYVDANNLVVKTIDSSDIIVSNTTYNYDALGRLLSLTNSSIDSSGKSKETEQHIWKYNDNRIAGMLRIKNMKDSSFVTFKLDENGNVIEEQETRKGIKAEPVYYYYDANNRVTDIVRYNKKAKKLLPEYMFEYSPSNQVIQKITVPANSDNYLIWRFQFNNQGLKTKEVIYNKQKQLTGKIEYQYSFSS